MDVDVVVIDKFLRRNGIPDGIVDVERLYVTLHEVVLRLKRLIVNRKEFEKRSLRELSSDVMRQMILSDMRKEKWRELVLASYPPLNNIPQEDTCWMIEKMTERLLEDPSILL
jgi:hypothetical protein